MADDGQGVAEAAVAPATRTNEGEILLSFAPTKETDTCACVWQWVCFGPFVNKREPYVFRVVVVVVVVVHLENDGKWNVCEFVAR